MEESEKRTVHLDCSHSSGEKKIRMEKVSFFLIGLTED